VTSRFRPARGLTLLLWLGIAACGGDGPKVAELKGAPTEDLPEQFDKAFANALHRVHLDASPPASCTDCHRIEDEQLLPSMRGRCEACHEGKSNPVHEKITPVHGRECLTCHDFVGDFSGPWRCADCHVVADPPRVDQAPVTISVHSKEACAACHEGHANVAFSVQCLECHEDVRLVHQKKDPPRGNEACLECHGGHTPAARATETCAKCHEQTVSSHTLFKGHDDCGRCHSPHPEKGSKRHRPLRVCTSCHDVKTMAAAVAKEHADCGSCHAPHSVLGSARRSCARCHDKVEVTHGDEEAASCVGCHPPHEGTAEPQGPKPCSACHEEATHDRAWHAGRQCQACHEPHRFRLEGGPAVCGRCHEVEAKAKLRAPGGREEPITAAHRDCTQCHLKAAHAPRATPAGCTDGGCHADVRGTSKGHAECLECHQPHSGAVFEQCGGCHGERLTGKHEDAAKACADCHQPHGPAKVAGAPQPKACVDCHDQPLPGLHKVAKHSACRDCHVFHGAKRVMSRSTCVGACHANEMQHEPEAVSCVGCHPFGG